jgi:CDP-diacylglycerol--glycerol-3-phosphate 3-phosphatidyltransferase
MSTVRIVLCPLFFIVYFLPSWIEPLTGRVGAVIDERWTVPVLWLFFLCGELSDLFDGRIARARGEVSDFGKLYDPFADTLSRIGYFLCFTADGIFPPILLLIVIYREWSQEFLRILMMKKGVAMGARWGGKIKAVLYMLAGGFALLSVSFARLGFAGPVRGLEITANVVYIVSIVAALVSFADYVRLYRRTSAKP